MANKLTGNLIRLAVDTLERALGPGTTGQIEERGANDPTAAVPISLRVSGSRRPHRMHLAWWDGSRDRGSNDKTLIWVLWRSPKRLVQKLRNQGENFVDLHRGWVRVRAPGLIVDRTDVTVPRSRSSERPLRDPFRDRASLVLRTLVSQPAKIWGTRELAQAAGVSTMTASHVVRQLEASGVLLVETEGRAKRICLESIESLVEAWSAHYTWKENLWTTYAAPIGDPQRFVRRLPDAFGERRWALTLHAGAALVSPIAVSSRVHVYLDVQGREDLHAIASSAQWHEAADGRVAVARPYYKESVWVGVRLLHGLPVVGDLQLILDLWEYPDRGREQAIQLLQRIVPRRESSTPKHDQFGLDES